MSTRLSGNLAKLNFSEIIKATCMKAKCCQLIVRNAMGEGTIYFTQGDPLHAQMGKFNGSEAINRLLTSIQKEGGVFTVDFDIKLPKRTITKSWDEIVNKNNNNNSFNVMETVEKPSVQEKPKILEQRVEPVTPQKTEQMEEPTKFLKTEQLKEPEKPRKIVQKKEKPIQKKEDLMGNSRGEIIARKLKELENKSPEIEGTAIVSTEGLIIASALKENFEEEHLAAISAIVLSLGERIVTELARGNLEQVFVKGNKGYVLISYCNADSLLVVITSAYVKLGMIFLDTKRVADQISDLL